MKKDTDGASNALNELYNIDIFPNLLFPDKKSPQVVAGDRYQIHFEFLSSTLVTCIISITHFRIS